MVTLLLAIIYLAFVSLGLPDSVLGATWPIMVKDLNVQISYMGITSIIISVGTIISSLVSVKLIKKIGTGLVTAISVSLTAIAMLGFAFSNSFWLICIFSIPYGIGAGAVDTALNNYVALHYSSRHMSWLHCCWGVGASLGPYIMGIALGLGKSWQFGYGALSTIQFVLSLIIFSTLFLWKKQNKDNKQEKINSSFTSAIKIKGVAFAIIAFFAYCAFETTAGLWASTYLVKSFNVKAETATLFASFFYLGITLGRFICGFVSDKLGDKNMIRVGSVIIALGIILLVLPLKTHIPSLIGLVILGIGGAPIYPCIMHSTPLTFGEENSQIIMGMQTASAYMGSTVMPPIFGLLAQHVTVKLFPYFILALIVVMILCNECLNKITTNKSLLKTL